MFDEQPDGDLHGECAAEIHRLQALSNETLDFLAMMFDAYEEGPDCYEDPEDCSGHIGKAIHLDDEAFQRIADILNEHRPRNTAVSPAPTFRADEISASELVFPDRYELPRCNGCGHLLHAGPCVGVTTHNVRSQATDAALSRQVACTGGLGVAVPSAPTFEQGEATCLESR